MEKIVKFKRTGNLYKIICSDSLMKCPETREWVQAVIYQQYKELNENNEYVEPENPMIFVREKKRF